MDGTEGFLSLSDRVKKCQNEESVLQCEANSYLDSGRKTCDCVPYHLMSFSTKVSHCIIDNSFRAASKSDFVTLVS